MSPSPPPDRGAATQHQHHHHQHHRATSHRGEEGGAPMSSSSSEKKRRHQTSSSSRSTASSQNHSPEHHSFSTPSTATPSSAASTASSRRASSDAAAKHPVATSFSHVFPPSGSSSSLVRRRAPRCLTCRCASCSLLTLVLLVVAAALAIGALYYVRWEEKKRDQRAAYSYLRELVEQVNSSPDTRWQARFNPYGVRHKQSSDSTPKPLKNLTAIREHVNHIQRFFDSARMREHLAELEALPDSHLPRHFDARLKWPHCASLQRVPNQGGCGSCYAVAAMGAAADRTCIHTNGTFRGELSVQDVLGCCAVCGNCYGGDPIKALVYWALEGVVSGGPDGCVPYRVATDCGTPCKTEVYSTAEALRRCERQCQPNYYRRDYADDRRHGSLAYTLYPRKMSVDQAGKDRVMLPSVIGHLNETSIAQRGKPLTLAEIRNLIKKELFHYGPTTLAMPLTEEFLHYESGVFHPYPIEGFEDRIIYWHVLRLVGWGHDDHAEGKAGKKGDGGHYWLAVNSFGSEWGEHGAVRVNTDALERFGLEYETGLL